MLWQIEIKPAPGQPDLLAKQITGEARDLGISSDLRLETAYGYLLQGELTQEQAYVLATQLLSDPIAERFEVWDVAGVETTEPQSAEPQSAEPQLVYVLPKPGVMDPVAQSALEAIADFQIPVSASRTFRCYEIHGLSDTDLTQLCNKVLANDSVEQVIRGALRLRELHVGSNYQFDLVRVEIRQLSDDALQQLSRDGQLYLTLVEMQTIQNHFQSLERDPTDIELETLAQTWSEHCSHKTLAGRIHYQDERSERQFDNMLKETIFAATEQIRADLGSEDWCVSVFQDNAGIVSFDDDYNVVFKVETHNHPSALEPYGGANTGIGGVIRDPMGTGLGAKPVCNTDVFCFAPPDTPLDDLRPGMQHPRRVMKGVVAGVRDYGNRMGIPTVNGAIYFDPRYLGNPLVYCGNVGILPVDKSFKQPQPEDLIVVIGGRTGRDGIHGATFSSAELTSESEELSGGAVQIGNAITEKMVLDVLLRARDESLFNAVTDCGAGGLSSAVGEMGEEIGAEVWLEKAPLKYDGLSYTEIWISEAQERMVLAVPPSNWDRFEQLCRSENVEASVIGTFQSTGRLCLKYQGHVVGDLPMEFLHDGRPPVIRKATYQPPAIEAFEYSRLNSTAATEYLRRMLGSWNVCSKEWVIRQYDHEVQAGSVVKPLVGAYNDGPSDAAVVRPRLDSFRGLAISCGMNPRYGDLDPYDMAASAIDEALRNAVAVGADPRRIAILDNFCWGYTDRAETLGSLVRAAVACRDVAVALQTPFISGKDSLNNEFSYIDDDGKKQTISIPPSLLISAMGQVEDVRRCVTMDLKQPGSAIYLVGHTRNEMGGSHLGLVGQVTGGRPPQLNVDLAKAIFRAIHGAMQAGTIRACHDLSEGGLAVAAAEMAIAGDLGMSLSLDEMPHDTIDEVSAALNEDARKLMLLFSESNTRFLCEVRPEQCGAFEERLQGLPATRIGETNNQRRLLITAAGEQVIQDDISCLKEAWQSPLNW